VVRGKELAMTERLTPHLEEVPPAARMIGKEIVSVAADAGEVRLKFFAKPDFCNRHGTVGGGFLAAMLDSSAATALLAKLPPELTAVTTELHVTFLRPASQGEVRGFGRVINHLDRDAESEAELSMPDGTTVARATAKFHIVSRRQ
jgi:uncharacterized protein (TIGR00369 family)